MSGDIERYGTGFVRIREVLKAYPEIEFSLEELADFFVVIEGSGDYPPSYPQATPQVTPQALDEILRLLRVGSKRHGSVGV